jgi:hypothetical protein
MITRTDWGAGRLTAYTSTIKPANRTGIIIHHSVTGQGTDISSVSSILRTIDGFHRRKGWGGIGYNFAVDHQGRVYEARGRDIIGVHAAGSNTANFGICFIGNSDKKLNPKAVAAVAKLVEDLQNAAGKNLKVQGHRDVNSTGCPGSKLYTEITGGTFNIRYRVQAFVLALPGDTYHKIAVRQLKLTQPNPTLGEKVAERKRIRKLNNGANIVAGMRVRIK